MWWMPDVSTPRFCSIKDTDKVLYAKLDSLLSCFLDYQYESKSGEIKENVIWKYIEQLAANDDINALLGMVLSYLPIEIVDQPDPAIIAAPLISA